MSIHINAQTFELCSLRFRYHAQREIGPNLLRGGFGAALKKISEEDYQRYFIPKGEDGPSGLRDWPRPFVFRFPAPEIVQMNVFAKQAIDVFIPAMRQIEALEINAVEREDIALSLAPITGGAERLRVHFVTPTELKPSGEPEFAVLMARIRDRISSLRTLWGEGPLDIDFQGVGQRASQIKTTRCELTHVENSRLSRNTGQRHSIGGFTGVVEYAGAVGEFLPYFEIARHTGVGRQTVWGKGEIRYETF